MISNELLEEYLLSNDFNFQTPAIIDLQNRIAKWISDGTPGAIIYGRPRVGKTRAILYIVSALRAQYGRELPIYIMNAVDSNSRDRFFYSEFLKAVGHAEYEKGTIPVLKERLLNRLFASACSMRHKKIVLFIDEAYNYSEKEYKLLMDIYNNLNLHNIRLYVFLVGTEELLARKQSLILTRQHQIVGRFMVEECHFKGIQSAKELAGCLLNYDTPLIIEGENVILTKHYFPEAFADRKYMITCAEQLMDQYIKVMQEIGIPTRSEIPMMYFANTVKYCMKVYGMSGKKIYFPTEKEWYESVMNSGYVAAERVYYNVPVR